MTKLDPEILSYCVCLIVLGVFIVGSNLTIVIAIAAIDSLRKAQNFYIASLSLADICVGVIIVPSLIITSLDITIERSFATCRIIPILELFCFCAGIFTLVLLSRDRYLAVVHAAKYAVSSRKTVGRLVLAWFLALIYSSRVYVQYLGMRALKKTNIQQEFNASSLNETRAYNKMCSFLSNEAHYDIIFRSIDFLFLLVLPCLYMCFVSRRIYKIVWGVQTSSASSAQRKKSFIKMLTLTIVALIFCWAPFYIFEIIHDIIVFVGEKTTQSETLMESSLKREVIFVRKIRLCLIYFVVSLSAIHPCLFIYFNQQFRAEVRNRLFNKDRRNQTHAVSTDIPGIRSLYKNWSTENFLSQNSAEL